MKKFLIKVNGIAYEVEVEEGGSFASSAPAPVMAAPVAAVPVAPAAVSAPAAPAAKAAPAVAPAGGKTGSEGVKAPMPGTILGINVAVGESVKKSQVLCILEAMKMENEIVAPRDGVVAGIHTAKGSSVNSGDLLVSLE